TSSSPSDAGIGSSIRRLSDLEAQRLRQSKVVVVELRPTRRSALELHEEGQPKGSVGLAGLVRVGLIGAVQGRADATRGLRIEARVTVDANLGERPRVPGQVELHAFVHFGAAAE